VHAHRGIEFQRPAAGCGLRITKHYADFLPDLVDEDQARARLGNNSGELAQGLRHQTRLESHMPITHLAIEFGFGHQGGDRVHDQDVNRPRTHKGLRNLKCLLAIIRLRDEQIVYVYSQLASVDRIERVLSVYKSRHSSLLLRFSYYLQGDSGLAACFRSKHLHYTSSRN